LQEKVGKYLLKMYEFDIEHLALRQVGA